MTAVATLVVSRFPAFVRTSYGKRPSFVRHLHEHLNTFWCYRKGTRSPAGACTGTRHRKECLASTIPTALITPRVFLRFRIQQAEKLYFFASKIIVEEAARVCMCRVQ